MSIQQLEQPYQSQYTRRPTCTYQDGKGDPIDDASKSQLIRRPIQYLPEITAYAMHRLRIQFNRNCLSYLVVTDHIHHIGTIYDMYSSHKGLMMMREPRLNGNSHAICDILHY
eukprot:771572_1